MTGATAGLGRYLLEHFPNAIGFGREDRVEDLQGKEFDVIVHCAFRRCQDLKNSDLPQVIEDNFSLTEKLLKLPHQKFVYLSSNRIYPREVDVNFQEDLDISVEHVENFSGVLKLMNEELVKSRSKNYCILRCTSLFGNGMKPNAMTRILFETTPTVSLTADSRLNCILYNDVRVTLNQLIEANQQGIFNLAASDSILLSEFATSLKKKVSFGNYHYDPGKIDTAKLTHLIPELKKTSWQNIDLFCNSQNKKTA